MAGSAKAHGDDGGTGKDHGAAVDAEARAGGAVAAPADGGTLGDGFSSPDRLNKGLFPSGTTGGVVAGMSAAAVVAGAQAGVSAGMVKAGHSGVGLQAGQGAAAAKAHGDDGGTGKDHGAAVVAEARAGSCGAR